MSDKVLHWVHIVGILAAVVVVNYIGYLIHA